MLEDPLSHYAALGCAVCTSILTIFQICQHLRNYTEPVFQRYTIRILFMVPTYAVASYLALIWREQSMFFETPRDCYEAWVIYNFMSLCMSYVGGPGSVVVQSEGKVIEPSWILCTCCWAPIPVNGFFLRRCKQGTLQFVILKPILAVIVLILFVIDKYNVSDWAWDQGYVYTAFIYNVSYTVALFWMLLFYVGTEELLHPYKPLLKFVCFKSVIFLTFWQSLVVAFFASRFNLSPNDSEALMNWLTVIEMMCASIGMFFAFPYSEYKIGGAAGGWSWGAFEHAVSISDVLSDIMHQLNPSYQSYVLYTDGGPAQNVKKRKFRGGRGNKVLDASDFVGFFAAKNAPRRKNPSSAWADVEEGSLDEEGRLWYGDKKPSKLKGILHLVPNKLGHMLNGHQRVGGGASDHKISDKERDQAELLDSESDADDGADEDNEMDNQLGGHSRLARGMGRGMLLDSDSDGYEEISLLNQEPEPACNVNSGAGTSGFKDGFSSELHLSRDEGLMFDSLAASTKYKSGQSDLFIAAVTGARLRGQLWRKSQVQPISSEDEAMFDALVARGDAPSPGAVLAVVDAEEATPACDGDGPNATPASDGGEGATCAMATPGSDVDGVTSPMATPASTSPMAKTASNGDGEATRPIATPAESDSLSLSEFSPNPKSTPGTAGDGWDSGAHTTPATDHCQDTGSYAADPVAPIRRLDSALSSVGSPAFEDALQGAEGGVEEDAGDEEEDAGEVEGDAGDVREDANGSDADPVAPIQRLDSALASVGSSPFQDAMEVAEEDAGDVREGVKKDAGQPAIGGDDF